MLKSLVHAFLQLKVFKNQNLHLLQIELASEMSAAKALTFESEGPPEQLQFLHIFHYIAALKRIAVSCHLVST